MCPVHCLIHPEENGVPPVLCVVHSKILLTIKKTVQINCRRKKIAEALSGIVSVL